MSDVRIMIDEQEHVTPEAAAARIGTSLPTLYRRVRAGMLQPRRALGRVWFALTDVDALHPHGQDANAVRERPSSP